MGWYGEVVNFFIPRNLQTSSNNSDWKFVPSSVNTSRGIPTLENIVISSSLILLAYSVGTATASGYLDA